jgi:hypothetical protein
MQVEPSQQGHPRDLLMGAAGEVDKQLLAGDMGLHAAEH